MSEDREQVNKEAIEYFKTIVDKANNNFILTKQEQHLLEYYKSNNWINNDNQITEEGEHLQLLYNKNNNV